MKSKIQNAKQSLAIPFISYSQSKGFALSSQAQEFLKSLNQDKKLGIISIVGKYRTGKSFFVNRVLLNQKKGGFQVGPTINPCTKGLWLWKKTIPSPNDPDTELILIDTEGFGGMDENANHDSRIFLFSLLLSSYFIYNSQGSIDENALNTLNLVINLAKQIQTKGDNFFPEFMWIVRDFTLQIVDKQGNKISSKQYLQNALAKQGGNSDAVAKKNKIRELFKMFFEKRDCMTMVRPVQRETDLQRLDTLDNSQLRPEFVDQVNKIRDTIFMKVQPKRINNCTLNGNLLVSFINQYTEKINEGTLPTVESAWFYVCRNQGIRAIQEANRFLECEIEKLMDVSEAMDESIMKQLENTLKESFMKKFKAKSMGSEQGHPDLLEKLQKKFKQNFEELQKRNKLNLSQKHRLQADKLIELVKDKVYRDSFNSFEEFNKEMEEVKRVFEAQTVGSKSSEKWVYFNELKQSLYILASQTISNRISTTLLNEKKMLQERIQVQQMEIQQKKKSLSIEKDVLKTKVEDLQRQNAKLSAMEQRQKQRIQQYKNEYEKLYEKFKNMEREYEEKVIELQRAQREAKKQNGNQREVEQAKSQVNMMRSDFQKQKTLNEMEKKYMQEQIERLKGRCQNFQVEIRKLRSSNAKLSSDLEELEQNYESKSEQADSLRETNENYQTKIKSLLSENAKRSELLNQHNEWLLEKAYLENQVSFLKNTLNENKRLHDALLVALQQSIVSSQNESSSDLMDANKNLSSALQKVEARNKVLQEKYDKVKSFKKVMKNCMAMQCMQCSKWIQTSSFTSHISQCGNIENSRQRAQNQKQSYNMKETQRSITESNLTNSMMRSNSRGLLSPYSSQLNRSGLHITVSQQTIMKDYQQNRKPYTQYIIQISQGNQTWKVSKRYKEFNELQQQLINKFPYIKYPPSCNFLADVNTLVTTKKNIMAEQRRKSIQQYLRDLSKIEEISSSPVFKDFLKLNKGQKL